MRSVQEGTVLHRHRRRNRSNRRLGARTTAPISCSVPPGTRIEASSMSEPAAARRAWARPVSEIEREKVEWLMPDRIPLAAVTLLVGDPGLGKSLYSHTLAALVSRAGGNALIATAEDSPSVTVRPRLEAAQAE